MIGFSSKSRFAGSLTIMEPIHTLVRRSARLCQRIAHSSFLLYRWDSSIFSCISVNSGFAFQIFDATFNQQIKVKSRGLTERGLYVEVRFWTLPYWTLPAIPSSRRRAAVEELDLVVSFGVRYVSTKSKSRHRLSTSPVDQCRNIE